MKRTLIILVVGIIIFAFSCWIFEMTKFATGVMKDEKKVDSVRKLNFNKQTIEMYLKKVDTINFHNDKYLLVSDSSRFKYILTLKNDTVLKTKNYYSHFFLKDFNYDGCDDLVFEKSPRYCGLFEVFIYDENHKKFNQVENILPNQWNIEGTNFSFSFERPKDTCCKWKSYLCEIKESHNIKLAVIYYDLCEENESLKLYTVDKQKEKFEKKISVSEFKKHSTEQDFLINYWQTFSKNTNTKKE